MSGMASNEVALALRSTARDLAKRCRAEGEGGGHEACRKMLADTGFLELRAQDGGGPAATASQTVVVVEELAASVCGAPFVGPLIASELARLTGGEGDPEATVVLAADLQSFGSAIAWDAARPVTAGLGIVDGRSVALELFDPHDTQDLSRRVAAVAEGVRTVGGALGTNEAELLAFSRLVLAADTLGAARGVFEDAVEYAKHRVQFGVPIGSFQAVQHLCAQAYGELEALRSAVLFAAWSLDTGEEYAETALVAKAYAASAGVAIVEKAIQVFGGVAITWEFPAHRHLRRVLMNAEVLGGRTASALNLLAMVEEAAHGVQ